MSDGFVTEVLDEWTGPRTSESRRALSFVDLPADRPLHQFPVASKPGDYWACDEPESPARTGIWWDERCPRCRIAYEAAARNQDDFGVWHRGELLPLSEVPWERFTELCAEADADRVVAPVAPSTSTGGPETDG